LDQWASRTDKPRHQGSEADQETVWGIVSPPKVKRFHCDSHKQLRLHLGDFMAAYNFARCLKTLNGLTPYEYICKLWASEPDQFLINSIEQTLGTNN
jgi:hypothetical protein